MAWGTLTAREAHGCVIVLASVVVYIPVAGIINSFGIFAEKLNTDFCPFDCLQLLGWIGALTFGLNRGFCWMVVQLQQVIPPFLLFVVGVGMCSASLLFASLIDRLQWLFLFYCVLYGFGSSLVMNTPFGLIEEIFPVTHRHHVVATSIMNVGAPIGMLLVNPLVAYLDTVEEHTWRDTMKIFSVVVLITGLVCSLPMTKRNCFSGRGDVVSERSFADYEDLDKETEGDNDRPVLILCGDSALTNVICWTVGMFLLAVAIFIPKVHFIQYMHDLSIDAEDAAACMAYEGLAEAALSFLISVLGDPISPYFLWMYALCTFLLAIASFFLVFANRIIHVAIYCTLHGAVDGLVITTIYPALPILVKGVKAKQVLWSLTFFVTGIGQVVGLPMAGLIYDETQSYSLVFYLASGAFGLSAVIFLFVAIRNANASPSHITEEYDTSADGAAVTTKQYGKALETESTSTITYRIVTTEIHTTAHPSTVTTETGKPTEEIIINTTESKEN